MDFKDRMIEAIENGLTIEDNAYDYVRESMADAADQRRKGQPHDVFMVGDRVIWNADDELGDLGGTVTRAEVGKPTVMVKLDTGGTFDVDRSDLRRLS